MPLKKTSKRHTETFFSSQNLSIHVTLFLALLSAVYAFTTKFAVLDHKVNTAESKYEQNHTIHSLLSETSHLNTTAIDIIQSNLNEIEKSISELNAIQIELRSTLAIIKDRSDRGEITE